MKKYTFECDCLETDHLSRICFETNEDEQDRAFRSAFICTNLNHYKPWYQRLWIAVKYVLGCDNTFSHHTDTLVSYDKFRDTIKQINKDLEKIDDEDRRFPD